MVEAFKTRVAVGHAFTLHVWRKLYLLNKLDTGCKIESKVNENPLDTFPGVFLLFQDEHVMVEELLKFLVCEVNTQLLKTVELGEISV